MRQRQLGTNGPLASALGLGCMGLSIAYRPPSRATAIATVNAALDAGVTLIDTADAYGEPEMGHNELLLAEALAGRREQTVLCSKFGLRFGAGQEFRVDSTPAWAAQACRESLRRLNTDRLDVYYLHRRDPAVPIEDTVGAMAELVRAGLVRHIGLSEVTAATLRAAHAVHPIAAVQVEYSLFTRFVEDDLLPTCRELGVALVAYCPLGRGLLSGAVNGRDQLAPSDKRRGNPRFSDANLARNLELVTRLRTHGAATGHTPAQLALAWLLARGDEVLPIPGTSNTQHLQENMLAADLELDTALLDRITADLPADQVAGERLGMDALRLVQH